MEGNLRSTTRKLSVLCLFIGSLLLTEGSNTDCQNSMDKLVLSRLSMTKGAKRYKFKRSNPRINNKKPIKRKELRTYLKDELTILFQRETQVRFCYNMGKSQAFELCFFFFFFFFLLFT